MQGSTQSRQPLTAHVWAHLLTSSPDWGADAAVSGAPTAFLLPGLPATSPHLSPGLGLGVALRAQSEERVRFTRQRPWQPKGTRPTDRAVSWEDWPAAGGLERRQRLGHHQDKHRVLWEGGRDKEVKSALLHSRTSAPEGQGRCCLAHSRCFVFFE